MGTLRTRGKNTDSTDIAIVGGGAAGLATAPFAARLKPARSVVVLEGASKLGAKRLLSGGGRCNVTNRTVTPADYSGGKPNVIKQVLAAFPASSTVAFIREIGVELSDEDNGKLFPTTNGAQSVLGAMVTKAARQRGRILLGHRVTDILEGVEERGLRATTGANTLSPDSVVLATGGRSFPETGSDGSGYRLAEKLGHALVPTTRALVPFVLDGDFHVPL